MLNAIVTQIATEIAIEGPKGVSRDKLWELVQELAADMIKSKLDNDTIKPVMDDAYKRYLWPFIVGLPQINYFEDTAQPMDINSQQTSTDAQTEPVQEDIAQAESIAQASRIRNAKETSKKRKSSKKQPAIKKKPKKKPTTRKKKAKDDDDDYTSDEYQPEDSEESEESDFGVDEEESNESEQEDKVDKSPKSSEKNESDLIAKIVDTSGYRVIDDIHMLSYDEIEQRYGSRLRFVADEELQNKQIYVALPPGRPLSFNLQIILGCIMRTRYHGMTQIEVTKEFGLDPRSSGHYVKSLELRGAIIRKPIITNGCRTSLCIHIRYNDDRSIHKTSLKSIKSGKFNAHNITVNGVMYSAKMLRNAVIALLADAPDNVMYSYDILVALGFNPKGFFVKKWYHRSLEDLIARNIIRRLNTNPAGSRTTRLIQLVDPSHASKEISPLDYSPTINESHYLNGCAGMEFVAKDAERSMRKGFMYDMPMEPQLLTALYDAGVKGATQKELQCVLRCFDQRALYKTLERLMKIPRNPNATRFTLYRNLEFEGRIRQYRYYTCQAYTKLTEGKDIEPIGPPNRAIKENELIEIDHRRVPEIPKRAAKKTSNAPKNKKAQTRSSKAAQTEPVQRVSRSNDRQTSATTTEASISQAETSLVNDALVRNEGCVTIDSMTSNVTDLPKSQPVSSAIASFFSPRKRTRSQASVVEGGAIDNTQTGQSADESAETPGTSTASSKRPRQTRSRSMAPKETDLSGQQTTTPAVASSSSETSTPRPNRCRNLFDYFRDASRQPPNLVEKKRDQNDESQATVPRSPGIFYQRLVTSSFEENTQVSEGIKTTDASPDKGIEEPIAPDAATDSEEQMETVNDPIINASASESDANSQDVSAPAIRLVPLTPNANYQMLKRYRKDRESNVITTKDGLKSARHVQSNSDINSYLAGRKRILLELIQEHSILEHSKETMEKFKERYKETYRDVKMISTPDKKTLWRSAESLAEDGDIQIVPMVGLGIANKTATRYLLVRADLDVNGPEVKAFKEALKSQRALNTPRTKVGKCERFHKNVERISERLARMEDGNAGALENISIGRRRILGDVHTLRSNVEKAVEVSEQTNGKMNIGNWLMIAIQYGFVPSKMLRLKFLHQYLLDLLHQGGKGIHQDKRVIHSNVFLANMTLGLCLQVIGFYESNARMSNFIKNPNNLETKLADLPKDILELVASDKNKFRRRLRLLLSHMLLLKLIVPTDLNGDLSSATSPNDDAAAAYMLPECVPLIDFWSEGRPVVREYRVETSANALIYWSELQCYCLTGDEKRSSHIFDASGDEELLIRSLTCPRNWNTTYAFSREQRTILNAYVDKKTGETPLKKPMVCRDIANSMFMPAAMVRNYFRMIEEAFSRKFEKPIIRSLEYDDKKRRTRRSVHTDLPQPSTSLSPSVIFKKSTRGSTARRLLQSRKAKCPDEVVDKGSRSQQLYLDNDATIPTIDEKTDVGSVILRRYHERKPWSLDEDELLLHAYVVIKARAERNYCRFYWVTIERIMPDRKGPVSRQRFAKLKVIPKIASYLQTLFSLWPSFYSDGLASGEIEDKDRYDMENFDFLGHVAYFIKRTQGLTFNKEVIRIELPDSREELESKYCVRTTALEEAKTTRLDDSYHSCPTLAQRYEILSNQFMGLHGYDLTPLDHLPENLVPEISEDKRIIELLLVFIRMILFTPDEAYDPFFAYGVLHQYPQSLSTMAIERMRDQQQLVKAKSAYNTAPARRIPGHTYRISEKYLNQMASGMPDDFYLQAMEFEKYLSSHGSTKYAGDIVSSGMMGCILNLVSVDKLDFTMEHENIQWMKHKISLDAVRLRDEMMMNVNFSLDVHGLNEVIPKTENQESQAQYLELDEASLAGCWSSVFNEQQQQQKKKILQTIRAHLDKVKGVGADIIEIKENIIVKYPRTSDSTIRECMDYLCTTSPKLVFEVGFSTCRYVLSNYVVDWVVIPKEVQAPKPKDKDAVAHTKELEAKRRSFILPRLWIDVNGNVSSPAIMEGCAAAVLGLVIMRPGIRERDVVRLLKESLSYIEIKDILEKLVKHGILRKTVTTHTGPQKVTLFSKRRSFTAVDPIAISRNNQTSYWATSDYYKIPLEKLN
ncbi:hypothetical protein BX666DRAFT_2109023 [Dichotomocladium elegans]|nr:hypothetical protein BX666DRAFT_2109023 [Dichotomocladium elegans]